MESVTLSTFVVARAFHNGYIIPGRVYVVQPITHLWQHVGSASEFSAEKIWKFSILFLYEIITVKLFTANDAASPPRNGRVQQTSRRDDTYALYLIFVFNWISSRPQDSPWHHDKRLSSLRRYRVARDRHKTVMTARIRFVGEKQCDSVLTVIVSVRLRRVWCTARNSFDLSVRYLLCCRLTVSVSFRLFRNERTVRATS